MPSVLDSPFIFGPPIKSPEHFYGREEETAKLLQCIRRAESVSVVGERRIGKTSFLCHLQNKIRAEWEDAHAPIPVFVDCLLRLRGEGDFFGRVIHYMTRQVPELEPVAQGPADEIALIRCLERVAPRNLVLLVDEFEAIALKQEFSRQFFEFLRAITQDFGVAIVAATSIPLQQCCDLGALPFVFCNVFQHIRLGLFDEKDVAHLIHESAKRSGVSLHPWQPQIMDLSGGFPAFTQLACQHYYEAAISKLHLSAEDHQQIRLNFEYQVEPYFAHIWNEYLNDEEREVLQNLVRGKAGEDSAVLRQLKRKGYVVDGRVFSSVFVDMFLRQKQLEPAPLSAMPQSAAGPKEAAVWLDEDGGVWVEGKLCEPPLTNYQYLLLRYLYKNAGRICDKYDIVEAVWSSDYIPEVDDQRIAKLVSRLRQRIEPDAEHPRYLQTVHGRGYKLVLERGGKTT